MRDAMIRTFLRSIGGRTVADQMHHVVITELQHGGQRGRGFLAKAARTPVLGVAQQLEGKIGIGIDEIGKFARRHPLVFFRRFIAQGDHRRLAARQHGDFLVAQIAHPLVDAPMVLMECQHVHIPWPGAPPATKASKASSGRGRLNR